MVEFLTQFQLSIFSLFAVIALTINIYMKEEIHSYSNRLYRVMLLNATLIMILEMLSWVFDGSPGTITYVLNYAFNLLLFMFSPAVPGFWVAYIDYKIHGDKKRLKDRFYFQFPFMIAVFLGIVNIFSPIVFSVDPVTNVYSRLPLVSINFIMVYGLLFYCIYQVIRFRRSIKSNLLVAVVAFLFVPAVASIIQFFHFGLILMWGTMGLVLLLVYLFLETTSSAKDYLTGLYSRKKIDEIVATKLEKNDEFTLVMMDLDDYKKINDTHGHTVGDQSIIIMANLLKSILSNDGIVARYGGDEFIILYQSIDVKKLDEMFATLRKRLLEYDDEVIREITFSYGISTRSRNSLITYRQMLVESDNNMYKNKAINKNYKRRKDDR